MKKSISMIGIFLACLVALCAMAGAQDAQEDSLAFAPGDSIALRLRLTAEAAGFQAQIVWDPTLLELENEEVVYVPEFKKGAIVSVIHPEPEEGTISLVYLCQQNILAEDAEVLELSFRVQEDATAGETEIMICDLQLVDAENQMVEASGDGICLDIVSADVSDAATAAPEETDLPEPTAVPEETKAARLYLEQVLPEESAEPTQEPAQTPAASATEGSDAEHTAEPDVSSGNTPTPTPGGKPAQTPVRPGGHISVGSGEVSAGGKPTATPAATPVPTIPSMVIDGAAQSPEYGMSDDGNVYLWAQSYDGGILVELRAKDVQIGGLQAEIQYDAASAELVHAAFSDAFLENAMIQMINDAEPGKIMLVYTNVEGYVADDSAIFSAYFVCQSADIAHFMLKQAKYTGMGADLTFVEISDQQVSCEIQPMEDLTIIETDRVTQVEVREGASFSLTIDPGETVAFSISDHEIPSVGWSSSREEIVSISPEGLADAKTSGLTILSARDVKDGRLLAEGRICVRNAWSGVPMEMISVSIGDTAGDTFVLSSDVDKEAWKARGIELMFQEEDTVMHIRGLLPEEMVSIPALAFDRCGNLVEVGMVAENILTIEAGAFLNCGSLKTLTIYNSVTELQANSLPASGKCILCVPIDSAAAACAQELEIDPQILEEREDGQ